MAKPSFDVASGLNIKENKYDSPWSKRFSDKNHAVFLKYQGT